MKVSSITNLFFLSSTVLVGSAMAQINPVVNPSSYPCGDPNDVDPIFAGTSENGIGNDATTAPAITSVQVGATCKHPHNSCEYLRPMDIHWHVYALPPGSTPKHSITPPRFIEPVLTNGVLEYALQDVLEEKYYPGETIEAGVQLYLPIDQLESIRVSGVETFVEINMEQDFLSDFTTKNLFVEENGVENNVNVKSPYVKVDLGSSGVDSILVTEVPTGSTLRLSGVDLQTYTKCDGLEIYMDGVDIETRVEGTVTNAVMRGVDGEMEINGSGCDNVVFQGVDNKCDYTDDVVVVNSLSCTVETEVGYGCWNPSTGAIIGMGIALFFICLGMSGGIAYCCRRRRHRLEATESMNNHMVKEGSVADHQSSTTMNDSVDEATVVEAEVLEVKSNDVQPTDVEAADGIMK